MSKTAPHPGALWWQRGVVYQIYPRSFQDTNGDGIGDLRGVLDRLDYLEWLGVDALWISPFYPSPMADFGYDVKDYKGVDPMFGDLAAFDALLAGAHARGIKILIDYVPNHTSDQHPWFIASRASRTSDKRAYYVWADGKADGSPPNNWLSVFGGRAWTWDEATGQYYLHTFLREQPDLNWRNPEVVEAMLDVLRFWLERGVDGFRIDAPLPMMKDPAMRDNPPSPPGERWGHRAFGEFDSQVHVHDRAHPDIHGLFKKFRAVLDQYSQESPRVSVGEIHVFDWKEWASYYGADLDEVHMPFNFGLLGVPWTGGAVREHVRQIESALRAGAWPNYVMGNHDEPRIAGRLGEARARIAKMLLLTLRGTPTIYYGDELGMPDGDIPPERALDPWERLTPGLGRDPERTPMCWSAAPNAGFCPAGVEPWLPLAYGWEACNVETLREDPWSILSLTRALLALRRSSPALHSGTYASVEGVGDECFAYLRAHEGEERLVALNFSERQQTLDLGQLGEGHIALSTHMDRDEPVDLKALSLRPDEGCVVTLKRG